MTTRLLGPGDGALLAPFGGGGRDDAFLTTPGCVAVAAIDDTSGASVGLVYGHELLHPDGDRTMLLYSLDVLERFRGRGHGRALVAAFVAEARRRKCSEVWVLTDDANPAGLATYTSAGGEREPVPQVMFTWDLLRRA